MLRIIGEWGNLLTGSVPRTPGASAGEPTRAEPGLAETAPPSVQVVEAVRSSASVACMVPAARPEVKVNVGDLGCAAASVNRPCSRRPSPWVSPAAHLLTGPDARAPAPLNTSC